MYEFSEKTENWLSNILMISMIITVAVSMLISAFVYELFWYVITFGIVYHGGFFSTIVIFLVIKNRGKNNGTDRME